MIYDIRDKTAWVNISGDGIVVHNGIMHEIDQQNMPDYLGYHLDIKFDNWFEKHTHTQVFDNITDISISTDGLTKLKKNPQRVSYDQDVVDLFLIQKPRGSEQNALLNSYLSLIEEEKYIPYDDIGIIRIIPGPGLNVNR